MADVGEAKYYEMQKKLLKSWSATIQSKQALQVELDGLIQQLFDKDLEIQRLTEMNAQLQQRLDGTK